MNQRSALDRFLAAVPAAVAALALLTLLFWEAAARKSPTIFSDELKWAQLSRAIAATGHAAQRGEPVSFDSLYAYAIAPVWWFKSTQTAYTLAKYLDTVYMSLTAIPVYLTARRLVSPRAALLAAVGSLCTSAMFFAAFLIPETIAYPMFAVCAYTAIRALEGGGRRWTIAAVVVALFAIEVRSELAVSVACLAAAAAVLWVVGPRSSRLRAGWSRLDYLGVALLLLGALVIANQLASDRSTPWATVTGTYQGRMWTFALTSFSAFALGLGLVPFAAGLASLWLPERRNDPRWRAFAAYTASAFVFFWLYTGVKAAYLSTIAYSRIEERNLIYLAPLLMIGTAIHFSARRPALVPTLGATAITAWLVLHYGYQLAYPYFDSPGYGVAAFANRAFHWTQHDIRLALIVACVVTLAALLIPRAERIPLVARTALVGLVVLSSATWMLTGEITSAAGASAGARAYYNNLPQPVNWVDRATHGNADVTMIGQNFSAGDDLGLNLLEFWNRSIRNVWSLDGSAPPPGPTLTPDLSSRTGRLSNDPGLPYALTANGVNLVGPRVATRPGLALVRLVHPWRLHDATYGVSADAGWIAAAGGGATTATGTYAYFGPGTAPGVLRVDVGRPGFCANSPGTTALIRVGPIALNEQRAAIVTHANYVKRLHVADCSQHDLTFTVRPPVAVQVTVSPLSSGTAYGLSDPRLFGAQVGFAFIPAKR